MTDEELVRRLIDAMDRYNPIYDEVFWEVSDHIRNHGEIGKLDLAALVCWKRSGQGHWVLELMEWRDVDVRDRCRAAFADVLTDQQRLDALAPLPGFKRKYAIATAVLACYDAREFGVIDRNALKGLGCINRPINSGHGITLRYLDRLRELRDLVRVKRPSATARNVDQGLWVLGSECGN
jgi:hypothetical protein